MSEEINYQAVAAQLSKPEGEAGIKTAELMNLSNEAMTRQAIDSLDCKDHDRILEIGPGNGRFAEYVLSKGPNIRYTGVDISETMIRTARMINSQYIQAQRVSFEQVDGILLPYPDHTFNRIFTVNTLYFWKDPARQLAEIKRILQPDGIFCLAIASKTFMERLPFTAFGFTLYTAEEAQKLLAAYGFELLSTVIREQLIPGPENQEIIREEVFLCAR